MFYDWRYIREKRIVIVFLFFILSFLLVFLRLSNIQVFKSSELAQRAIRQQTREVSLEIKGLGVNNNKALNRGLFYDRRHESLLDSREVMRVVLFPKFTKELDESLISLGEILNESPSDIKKLAKTEPVILPFELTTSQVSQVKALNLSGVAVTMVSARVGSEPLAVNLFGYLWDKDGVNGGLEEIYNRELKGLASEKSLIANVNVKGELIPGLGLRVINKVDPNRKHVVTTIDKRVQEIVESVMDTYVEKGAVVVMDVATGDILASASRPNFDPTDMTDIKDYNLIKDRAVRYENSPPGSVFKVLVAAAAIEEGIADENTEFQCKNDYFKNCNHDVIPHLTLSKALAVSCNNTFFELASQLGKDKLVDYIRKFNLDTQTIIGYPEKSSQFIELLKRKYTLKNAAIGQDPISLSPIQVTTILNTIANGGIYRTPRMVQQLIDSSGKEFKRFNVSSGNRIISFETAQMVHRMLTRVTGSEFGTGKQAYVDGYGSAGKTGTAEVDKIVNGKKAKTYNSWFSGYAPVQKPELVVTVLIEKPKETGVKATKVFKEIMTKSLSIEIK